MQEWLKWFTETSSALTSTDLDVIFGEMEESAESMTTVVRCTRLAAEPPTAVSDASDAGPPPLDATRKAAVEALFKAWDFEARRKPRPPLLDPAPTHKSSAAASSPPSPPPPPLTPAPPHRARGASTD